MSVATAGAAVSTQHHQPTQEQIRLAQLIDDTKHNQPEVQEIIRKVLDVVENSNQEDALVALFDCDYDYEKAVALLIEKGHDVASEWRTATSHKLSKKQQQQQQKVAATKNGHEESNENGQQRGNSNSTSRGKSRGGRARFQQNGGDSQNVNNQQQPQQQQNDNDIPQQRQRGGSGYRGRYRGNNRGGFRGNDRNYQQQQNQQQNQQQTQDSNGDTSSPSDTTRRNRGAAGTSRQEQWDVGNWNGETLIISRTNKDDEQTIDTDESSAVQNGQSDRTNQDKSKSDFDPIEAARQIKNVIGIGQTPKTLITDQHQKSKPTGQTINTKVTPPPPTPRIPHQPVIFSDHYDGGVNKIDVQFGNLSDTYDDTGSSAFYQQTDSASSNKISQRTTEQSSHISPATRPSEQPVMNQQRILLTQIQQPSMTIKPVVTPQYAVHQQQHQVNTPNMLLQSLLFHHPQQQPEPVTLDTPYDPTTFSLPSIEFNAPYFMAAAMNQPPPQQQTQPRYLVSQQAPPQQTTTKNAQTPSVSTSTSSTTTKKAPAVPPGIFPPTAQPPPLTQATYSTAYGVQQQTGGPTYSTPYDAEHLFSNAFMPLTNAQQAQSPSGGYGSVTPPVPQQNQQQQQTNNNNDNKTMNFRAPITENLMLLQQYQQYALQQSTSQQHGQQAATHSPAQLNYFLGHPPSGSSYSPGPQIMYAPAPTAMTQQQQQQQAPKQQGQQYNQNNSSAGIGSNDDYYHGRGSSSSNKEGQYIYQQPNQPQHVPQQSAGQQQGVNKQQQQQQQQRTSGNVYNNQQGQQRPFQ
ncbi:unnamed protein product [Adineta steineri]|uniref:UBA domain-containing protein n=1 Tax=Adineta steineri TaxID=433720 RepID=A0A814I4I7_9BILA|nr:unnamed protein product [Adineta steineri]